MKPYSVARFFFCDFYLFIFLYNWFFVVAFPFHVKLYEHFISDGFLLMDFGPGQYIIWRYIEYFINKYVRSFEWRTENTNHITQYRVHISTIGSFWFFLCRFCHHFLSLALTLSILHIPSQPPYFFLSRNAKNDKLFMKKVYGTKFERSFLWKRKKSSKIMEIGLISWYGLIL